MAFALGIDRKVTNCPLQTMRDGHIVCGAILLEAAYVSDHPQTKPFIGDFLGTGLGCCLLIFGYEGDNDLPEARILAHMLKIRANKAQFEKNVAVTYGRDKSAEELQGILVSQIKEYAAYADQVLGSSIAELSRQALAHLSHV
ncbi:hypothetical protein AA14337_3198 [Acetobacter malorum DSM 14337]|uniref:Uncharacterized protein n=2 Tax=Acetobacter malorum TaxID=178901 RepID=A0ABQ0Q089_9PROT|nr:hypothetical protein AD930_11690 [Acetobacter malorum]GBQ85927.1 hypothetical protein AA14337_3198 [Acetobacter malorum DSM 14337]